MLTSNVKRPRHNMLSHSFSSVATIKSEKNLGLAPAHFAWEFAEARIKQKQHRHDKMCNTTHWTPPPPSNNQPCAKDDGIFRVDFFWIFLFALRSDSLQHPAPQTS
jgi:hypothetical protein